MRRKTVVSLAVSIAIGEIAAVFLAWVRGGWRDHPSVLAIFFASGFALTYGVTSLLSSGLLPRLEAASLQSPLTLALRDVAGLALLVASLTFSGPVIQNAGYSGWLVALLLAVVWPLVVCLVAYHAPVLVGVLVAGSLVFSPLLYNPYHPGRWYQLSAWQWLDHRKWVLAAWCWGLFAVLSMATSIPIAVRRRRITSRCCGPARVAS